MGDKQEERESRRLKTIVKATDAAIRVIADESDSPEEASFFTAEVAKKMVERALLHFSAVMMTKDMKNGL